MADLESLFRGTTAKTVTKTVCLSGELAGEYADLERELVVARTRDDQSFAGGEARRVVERMDAIREQMAAAEVTFTFTALPPMKPLDLLMAHPPREDDKADKALGYNQETYYPALVKASCTKATARDGSTKAATDIPDDAWESMLGGLGHADFDALVAGAMEANGRTTVPFSRLASQISQKSEAGSKPPRRGTSPRSGSRAGNPKRSQSSSTTTQDDSSAP